LTIAVGLGTGDQAVGGWGFFQPSQNLVDAFQVDDDGFPILNGSNPVVTRPTVANDMRVKSDENFTLHTGWVDPRLDWTVARRGVDFNEFGIFPGNTWIRSQENGGPYMTKKFTQLKSTPISGAATRNPRNFRYHRLAHVILWRAEVAVEDGDLDLARRLVNRIRERARDGEWVMGRVNATQIPVGGSGSTGYAAWLAANVDMSQPAANYKVEPYPADHPYFADKNIAREAVRLEIRLEFATENHRFFDLRRWGEGTATPNYDKAVIDHYIVQDAQFRNFMSGAVYTVPKNRYWPVPKAQLEIMEALSQDPHYKQ